MRPDRWEHGSDFALPTRSEKREEPWRWPDGATFWGCGRDAMRALAAHRSWKRLWVGSYACHPVLQSLRETGLSLLPYADSPLRAPEFDAIRAEPGDAVLVTNYFGLRTKVARPLWATSIDWLEDHTHDPLSHWSQESDADYAVASLRKSLPIPDGGVLWSPRGETIPEAGEATREHLLAAQERLVAMVLKADYLAGGSASKEAYRALAVRGEESIAEGAPSAIAPGTRAMIDALPLATMQRKRAENFQIMRDALAGVITVLEPERGATPYCATLLCRSHAQREQVRRALVAERIYPAVLWPDDCVWGEQSRDDDRALSERVLCLHTDARYGAPEMGRVASAVHRALQSLENDRETSGHLWQNIRKKSVNPVCLTVDGKRT